MSYCTKSTNFSSFYAFFTRTERSRPINSSFWAVFHHTLLRREEGGIEKKGKRRIGKGADIFSYCSLKGLGRRREERQAKLRTNPFFSCVGGIWGTSLEKSCIFSWGGDQIFAQKMEENVEKKYFLPNWSLLVPKLVPKSQKTSCLV